MTSCHHHSGYEADDEAGHTTYLAPVQPPKKPTFPEIGQASKLGHMPHPPSKDSPSSGLHSHHQNSRDPQPFGSFLDFLVKGQVLDSLQTVVEKATEHIATMKTEAGVPLVEVQDPVEVPRGGRRVRARPSLSTVHRHRVRPSLCTGNPNNYPSCSSSMSDSHSNFTAGWQGSHSQDSNLCYHGLGPLPPMRDKLLQEKSLKRLLRLENRGKSRRQSCSQGALLWDSVGSQSSSQWTQEQPLLGFSDLLGSSLGTPEASELGPGERELIFLEREFNKKIKSLLSQPAFFNLPGYCPLQEPHRTLDFLAEHHLFPALQRVVSQAVDKLSGARRHNGCPLFPSEWKSTTKPNSNSNSNSEVTPGSKWATTTEGEEHYDYSHPTTASSLKMVHKKSTKSRGWDKPKEDGSPMSSAQGVTRFRLQVTPIKEPKIPSPHSRQEAPDQDPKVQRPPMSTSEPLSSNQRTQPWRRLHLTLPAPGIKVEVPSSQTHLTQSPSYTFMKKKPLPSISSKSTISHFFNPRYEELNYLMEQTVSLLICKYKFERNLTKQLGFISFPVTEALMDLFLGFKKVKGSHIHLSSNINWSCLLHKLEEAQWAAQVSQPVSQPVSLQASHHKASQHTASHSDTAHHSTESPSTLPEPATLTDQEVATESCLHTELLGPQLHTPQENSTAEEQEPTSLLEPKLSKSYGTSTGSNKFEQAVDVGKSQSSEENEEEEVYEFFGDESETLNPTKPQVEAKVNHSADSPGDPQLLGGPPKSH